MLIFLGEQIRAGLPSKDKFDKKLNSQQNIFNKHLASKPRQQSYLGPTNEENHWLKTLNTISPAHRLIW